MDKKPYKVGDEYPVWWETLDGRPDGQHQARILEVLPYTGRLPQCFSAVLRLSAPRTAQGWLEMCVE